MSRSRIVALENLQQFTAVNVLSDPGAIAGPVIVPSCAQVVLAFTLESGKVGHCVLYGRYTGAFAGSVAQANALLTAFTSGTPWTNLAAFFSTTNSLSGIQLRDVNTANNPIIQSTGGPGLGTSASPSMPNEVAAVVTLRTAFVGAGFRGRAYVPGWATNALGAGNIIAGGAVTALQAWANAWSGIMSAQGYTFVLGQKARAQYTGTTGRVHPARAATSTAISSAVVRDNHWDTQRRRGLK